MKNTDHNLKIFTLFYWTTVQNPKMFTLSSNTKKQQIFTFLKLKIANLWNICLQNYLVDQQKINLQQFL